MIKTICTLTIAATYCVIFGNTAQARTEIIEIPIERVEPRAKVLSGATLSGRREVIAEDATIIDDGAQQRALIRRGGDVKTPRIRHVLPPGTDARTNGDNVEREVDIIE